MAKESQQFGPSVQRDETLTGWLRAAAEAAGQIGQAKAERLAEWLNDVSTPREALDRIRELPRVLFDDDLVELNHQATLAAMLYGMVAGSRGAGSGERVENSTGFKPVPHGSQLTAHSSQLIRIANASQLLDRLPFAEAIDGLAQRLGLIKWSRSERDGETLPAFMELDAANRSRAFTMAWIDDLNVLDAVHKELVETVQAGESLYDFRMRRLEPLMDKSGWLGSPAGEWHYQLVYRQNLSMAYTAGRYEQGRTSGFKVVRILPTLSQSPRPDHAKYAGGVFRVDEQSSLPPWDFGCNCGWEWVFPEELEQMRIDPADLPLLRFDDADQNFQWRPAAYMALSIDPGQYTGPVRDIAEGMAGA